MDALKQRVADAVERLGDQLTALSLDIHAHPELAYQEVQAAGWVGRFLTEQGFKVERGRGRRGDRVPRDHRDRRRARPSRSCASTTRCPASATRAGTTSSPPRAPARAPRWPRSRAQLPKGRIQVIGTPAEEGGGGKVKLIKGGVFQDVDAAMMIHGFDRTLLHQDLLGIVRGTFEFTGKAVPRLRRSVGGRERARRVHPDVQRVSMLRQQMRPDCRIHGIVTNGGAAPNIIPEYAAATFYVRAPAPRHMWALYKRVVACAEGAAKATGVHAQGDPASTASTSR